MTRWTKEGRGARGASAEPDSSAPRLMAPLGQGLALQRLQALARQLRLPHAILVEGPRGSGKSTIARWLAAALLCPSDLDPSAPCGMCRTCRLVASGGHADLHVVDRAQDQADVDLRKKSRYVIKVDQVREVQQTLARTAHEGRARVLLLDDADHMDEEAQNALLKTLEEPAADTFLLLEASRPERLLPTVRSRVQRLRAVPLPGSTIRQELQRRVPECGDRHDRAVSLANGCLGAALRACTEQAVQLHDLVLEVLGDTQGLRPVRVARAALTGAEDRFVAIEQARLFLWLLRAELRAANLRHLAGPELPPYPASLGAPWTRWIEFTLAAEQDLDLLIPPEQALAGCLLQFAAW